MGIDKPGRDPAQQAQAVRIGRLIREARERRAASLGFDAGRLGPYARAAVAKRLRVTVETLRRWEIGQASPPSRGTVRSRLARDLGVTLAELEFDKLDASDG